MGLYIFLLSKDQKLFLYEYEQSISPQIWKLQNSPSVVRVTGCGEFTCHVVDVQGNAYEYNIDGKLANDHVYPNVTYISRPFSVPYLVDGNELYYEKIILTKGYAALESAFYTNRPSPILRHAKATSSGEYVGSHGVVLDVNGVAHGYGDNNYGQLGVSKSLVNSYDRFVKTDQGNIKFISIYAVFHATCGLSTDNIIYIWGHHRPSHFYGVVDSTLSPPYYKPIPLKKPSNLKVSSISLTNFFNLILLNISCYGLEKDDVHSCSGHGVCRRTNECFCDPGWHGDSCSFNYKCFGIIPDESTACSGHGNCITEDVCRCNYGYFGEKCNYDYRCGGYDPANRQACGRGRCVSNDTCDCPSSIFLGLDINSDCSTKDWFYALLICIIFFGVIICAAFVLALIIGILCFHRAKKKSDKRYKQLIENADMIQEDENLARIALNKAMFEIEFKDLKIINKIAEGGSGAIIYQVHWKNHEVAIKFFQSSSEVLSDQLAAFEREVGLLGSLHHPNIVRFFGCCLEYPKVGIVTEYCEYKPGINSLGDWIKSGKHKNSKKLKILLDIAEGMRFLHSHDIVHRDLKSDNVLLDKNCTGKITDFGISKVLSHEMGKTIEHTQAIGTSYYMAPEVTMSQSYDVSCDVFAFGMIMYEVLSNSMNPFKDRNLSGIAFEIAKDPNCRPDITPFEDDKDLKWYVDMMKKCWDHDPALRPNFSALSAMLKSQIRLSIRRSI